MSSSTAVLPDGVQTGTQPAASSPPGTLTKAKSTMKYLMDPQNSPQPTRLRTRAFLRSVRYLAIFAFWRLVRYAKYAAVGAIAAAISGTVIGSVVSGAAFVVAPTGILGGAGMGIVYAVARFGWRRATKGRKGSGDPRRDEHADAEGKVEEERRAARLPRADPW